MSMSIALFENVFWWGDAVLRRMANVASQITSVLSTTTLFPKGMENLKTYTFPFRLTWGLVEFMALYAYPPCECKLGTLLWKRLAKIWELGPETRWNRGRGQPRQACAEAGYASRNVCDNNILRGWWGLPGRHPDQACHTVCCEFESRHSRQNSVTYKNKSQSFLIKDSVVKIFYSQKLGLSKIRILDDRWNLQFLNTYPPMDFMWILCSLWVTLLGSSDLSEISKGDVLASNMGLAQLMARVITICMAWRTNRKSESLLWSSASRASHLKFRLHFNNFLQKLYNIANYIHHSHIISNRIIEMRFMATREKHFTRFP